ncbi:MAG: hypothetical protein ABUK08_00295 [Candidatus Humimicrobiaceae bacterium]
MDKKKKFTVFRTEEDECLCHACAMIIFKQGKKIPLGEKVTEIKECVICGYKINR